MTIISSSTCSFVAFIREVIHKTTDFQIIYRPSLQEFDDIYNKEIAKRYKKHEIKRLSKRKDSKKRERRYVQVDISN